VCKFEVSVNGDSETTGGGRVVGVNGAKSSPATPSPGGSLQAESITPCSIRSSRSRLSTLLPAYFSPPLDVPSFPPVAAVASLLELPTSPAPWPLAALRPLPLTLALSQHLAPLPPQVFLLGIRCFSICTAFNCLRSASVTKMACFNNPRQAPKCNDPVSTAAVTHKNSARTPLYRGLQVG
jgi:hypothetical protein